MNLFKNQLWVGMWAGLVASNVACSDTGESVDGSGAFGGTTSGGAGGTGASGGAGATGGGGSGGDTGGSGGGTGGAPSSAEQCQTDACAHLPGCAACETLCEEMCFTGCGPGCGVDYMVDCLQPATCADVESLFTLTKDSDLFACFSGVPANLTCGFAASSVEHCWVCTYDECGGALAACEADAACEPWLACITTQDCPDYGLAHNPECYRECDEKFPDAAPLYEAVYACTCASCLDEACEAHADPCSVVGPVPG